MKKIEAAIDAIVRKTMAMDLTWDWPGGVAYYGVAEACARMNRPEYGALLRVRIDELIVAGLPKQWTVNACAMGHCLISLYATTGDARYWDIALSKLSYLRDHAPRFAEGVLQHTVSANNDFPEQAWADTLFMAAYFMLRMGIKMEDQAIISDALSQWKRHISFLQDPETSLWYHGYNHIAGDHMSGFYWARANAWAAYTMSRVLPLTPGWYLYPAALDVQCSLRDQLAALKYLQTENGLWRTVLDDNQSYEEVSATCGIAAAMLEGGNPLHRPYAEKALSGVLANITPDGRVLNVSGGTAVMRDLEGYRAIPRTWIQGWGQGLALAFLTAYAVYRSGR
jgi:unsaturated rhamnogalacturonyl hydrolase